LLLNSIKGPNTVRAMICSKQYSTLRFFPVSVKKLISIPFCQRRLYKTHSHKGICHRGYSAWNLDFRVGTYWM